MQIEAVQIPYNRVPLTTDEIMNTGFVVLPYLHKVHKRKGKRGDIGYNLYTIRIKCIVIYI